MKEEESTEKKFSADKLNDNAQHNPAKPNLAVCHQTSNFSLSLRLSFGLVNFCPPRENAGGLL
jgi:hypothetical protein